jgi:hypothetical protein
LASPLPSPSPDPPERQLDPSATAERSHGLEGQKGPSLVSGTFGHIRESGENSPLSGDNTPTVRTDVDDVDKTGDNPGLTPMRPGPRGGMLRTGGTNKGGPGRPRKAWKEFCRETIEDPAVQAAVRRKAEKGYTPMVKLLADHGEGAPEQRIILQADTAALDRLFARLAPQVVSQVDPRAIPETPIHALPPATPDSRGAPQAPDPAPPDA